MSRPLRYVAAFAIAIVAVYVLSRFGITIRAMTPEELHQPLWMTGAVMCLAASAGVLLFRDPPFALSARAWQRLMFSAALIGLLLFSFFVHDLDCKPAGKSGLRCEQAGQTSKQHAG